MRPSPAPSRKASALIALAQRGATVSERALAAHKAADALEREGIDYLSVFPMGLPEGE